MPALTHKPAQGLSIPDHHQSVIVIKFIFVIKFNIMMNKSKDKLSLNWLAYLKSKNLEVITSSGLVEPRIILPDNILDGEIEDYCTKFTYTEGYASAKLSLETKPNPDDFTITKKYVENYWVKLTIIDSTQIDFFQKATI